MKRDIIKIDNYSVTITGNNVWMAYWEIAYLLNVVPATMNRAIKRLFKEGVLSELEHSKYIQLPNGNHAYVYSLDIVTALSFRFKTYNATLFRKWMIDKIKEQHPPIFISFPIKDVYGC